MKLKLLIFSVIFILIYSCKTEIDVNVPSTEVEAYIQDDLGSRFDSIPVWLFDDEEQYNKSVASDTATGFAQMTRTKNGYVQFSGLQTDKKYHLFISYRDTSRFLNIKNKFAENTISNTLTKSSLTTLKITAYPSNGILSFWSNDQNADVLDISVFVKGNLVDSVKQTINTEPISPHQKESLTFNRDPGVYQWYAKGKEGCLWEGQLDVKAGFHHKIELTQCRNGTIAFYAEPDIQSSFPITVVLNTTDTIGVITSPTSGIIDCKQTGIVSAFRPAGSYTYYAYSPEGTCIWTGNIDLAKGDCKIHKLEYCSP